MAIPPTPLAHLSPEHRQLVVRGAEEESVTETEWIERAIVLRASERGVTADRGEKHPAGRHRVRAAGAHDDAILAGISAEHRDLVSAGAEQEAVTAKEWIERAVVLKATHAPPQRHEARTRAQPASHAAEAPREETVEHRRDEEVEARRAPPQTPRPRHEEARPERGFSAYHSHIAARAAAAEAMPLEVWMEEAILDRAGYRGRAAARPPEPPAAPPPSIPPPLPPAPPPPAAPASWETVVVGGGRGGLVIGVLLGVLLAIVLILFLSWIRAGGGVAAASPTAPATIPIAYVWTTPSAPLGPPPTNPAPPATVQPATPGSPGSPGAPAAPGSPGTPGAPATPSGPSPPDSARASASVVVRIIERDRVEARSPTRRSPVRRFESRRHAWRGREAASSQDGSGYYWRSDDRQPAWPANCGCDARADVAGGEADAPQ